MKVYVVMAVIDGAPFVKGVYKEQKDAENRAEAVTVSRVFFAEEGDEVWVEEWNLE